MRAPVERRRHQPDGSGATGDAEADAGEVDAEFRPVVVAHQPVEDQPGAEQHGGRTGEPGKVTRGEPDPDIGGQAHHQRAGDGDDHADPVQAILEMQVADQRGNQRTAEVAGVIDRRQPSAFGQAKARLLLHQWQQRRVGKAGDAEGEQQAEDAGSHHLEALDLFSIVSECHCCRS